MYSWLDTNMEAGSLLLVSEKNDSEIARLWLTTMASCSSIKIDAFKHRLVSSLESIKLGRRCHAGRRSLLAIDNMETGSGTSIHASLFGPRGGPLELK